MYLRCCAVVLPCLAIFGVLLRPFFRFFFVATVCALLCCYLRLPRLRVRAAFFAAVDRRALLRFLVAAAFFAAFLYDALLRFLVAISVSLVQVRVRRKPLSVTA